jgi:Predicted metal-dependent hydrolase of the TIM-barrel fold
MSNREKYTESMHIDEGKESGIMASVRNGQPLRDTLVIDCHCHFGDWRGFHVPNGYGEGMLKSMDALGIKIACLAAHAAVGPDFCLGNRQVIEAVMSYPNRFIGYVTLNPHYAKEMEAELEVCFALDGFKGIKLHPGLHVVTPDDRRYEKAYAFADRSHCPMLIHTWGVADLMAVEKMAGQYSGGSYIMAHAGGSVQAMETAIEIVNRNTNIFIDTAFSMAYEGNIEWLTEQVGSEKILFGSDMPFFDPRIDFGRVVWAKISDEAKKNILGLNMKKLLYL